MFNAIYSFLGSVLGFFSNLLGGNYLFGLFLFAIIIKLLMLPFGIKQQKTSIRQAKLRPREMAIRKKYAGRDDRTTQQKMQQEIMDLYQQEGYNPAGGCLPMIIQMVIILMLYQVIIYPLQHVVGMDSSAVEAFKMYLTSAEAEGGLGLTISGSYQEIQVLKIMIERGADSLISGFSSYSAATPEFITELSNAFESGLPSFDLFGIQNFPAETPAISSLFTFPWTNSVWLVFVPVLNFATQFFTMKLTKKLSFQPLQQDQQQQMGCTGKAMDWMMPALTLYIAFTVPSAIGIYWLFNNFLGIAQTYILHKAMPLPVFTEEDYKKAEKEMKSGTKNEKAPKAVEGVRSNPNSLHTIDFEEEDYAVLPDYESVYDKPAEEREESQAAIKAKSEAEPNEKIGTAPLKGKKNKKK